MLARPVAWILVGVALAGCGAPEGIDGVFRLGFFANLTHGQALYATESGLFERAFEGGARVETQVFHAGPSALEALLAGRVDAIYVGPSPTIAALAQTGADEIRIVSGAASGGARFIVRQDLALANGDDLRGKKFASPQLGNTQDVALRHYIRSLGQTTSDAGGDVAVVNAANPDILALFQQGLVDGAWVPEPWATRLLREGNGRVAVNESDLWTDGRFVTTHVVVRKQFLDARPDDVARLVRAHVDATEALQRGSADAWRTVNAGILTATGKDLAEDLLFAAAGEITFTHDPLRATFEEQAKMSGDLGFLQVELPSLDLVYDGSVLERTLTGREVFV